MKLVWRVSICISMCMNKTSRDILRLCFFDTNGRNSANSFPRLTGGACSSVLLVDRMPPQPIFCSSTMITSMPWIQGRHSCLRRMNFLISSPWSKSNDRNPSWVARFSAEVNEISVLHKVWFRSHFHHDHRRKALQSIYLLRSSLDTDDLHHVGMLATECMLLQLDSYPHFSMTMRARTWSSIHQYQSEDNTALRKDDDASHHTTC